MIKTFVCRKAIPFHSTEVVFLQFGMLYFCITVVCIYVNLQVVFLYFCNFVFLNSFYLLFFVFKNCISHAIEMEEYSPRSSIDLTIRLVLFI